MVKEGLRVHRDTYTGGDPSSNVDEADIEEWAFKLVGGGKRTTLNIAPCSNGGGACMEVTRANGGVAKWTQELLANNRSIVQVPKSGHSYLREDEDGIHEGFAQPTCARYVVHFNVEETSAPNLIQVRGVPQDIMSFSGSEPFSSAADNSFDSGTLPEVAMSSGPGDFVIGVIVALLRAHGPTTGPKHLPSAALRRGLVIPDSYTWDHMHNGPLSGDFSYQRMFPRHGEENREEVARWFPAWPIHLLD